MFVEDFDITTIQPASYNPRYLSAEKMSKLVRSIREVGFLKPIIVNSTGTIIAGHQRTKCLLSMGIKTAPAYVIDSISVTDEVRFNQLHNGSDVEVGQVDQVAVDVSRPGWSWVDHDKVRVLKIGKSATQKAELVKLLTRYGEFGASVVGSDGRVIVSADYASCCKAIRKNLLVYRSSSAKEDERIVRYFSDEYGVFNYEMLEKKTYIQSLAQMHRLKGVKKRKIESTLYRLLVIPELQKGVRVLDFGAGRMGYVEMLRAKGYDIRGIEFYLLKSGGASIDTKAVNALIDDVLDDVSKNGLYDVVVCDSVLNSVDSMAAHNAVIDTVRAFCRIGGTVYFSGRSYEFTSSVMRNGIKSDLRNNVYFCDENLFTANLRLGNWFYQKFHTREMVENICREFSLTFEVNGFPRSSWQAKAVNEKPLDRERFVDAITFEFSLPLPKGTYNRADDVLNVLSKWRSEHAG
ncbi:MAG: ParB N-terminal domain-containing protein [Chlorobiaceae bacterium]|nr:ParB N-terminal domain-containing protein [Chlorobiaceae bacterium]